MTYRVGVIGCGRMAGTIDDEIQYHHNDFILPYGHANGYAAVPEVDLVASHHAGGVAVDLPLADRNVRVMSH